MAVGDFDNNYGSNPWPNMVSNQRQFYEPMLQREYFMRHVIFQKFVDFQFNLGDVNAKTMTLTGLIEPHANFNSIGLTQMWLPSSRIDSKSRDVTFQHKAGKLAFDKYSKYVTYWKKNKVGGLETIIRDALGGHQTRVLEKLARNAFLKHPYKMIGDGSLTGIDQLGSSNTISSAIISNIHLAMAERGVSYAIDPTGRGGGDNIFCVTTPGVVQTISDSAAAGDWLDVVRYANPSAAIVGEAGTWKGVRFLKTNEACLYNAGSQAAGYQKTITAALTQGSGAPATTTLVDGVYRVGQASGVTNSITVNSTSGMAVGDRITIHVARTSAYGVTNGVDWEDGTAEERRIVDVTDGTHIKIHEPIMEDFSTDLGGGVYGYITKGRHVHTATFIGAPGGVSAGVSQPPELHTPDELGVIDDVGMMYRFSWDAYLGYAPFTPEVFTVWMGSAKNAFWNQVQT